MKLIDCYYIIPETVGRFQLLRNTGGGYAAMGCYLSPGLAARDISESMKRRGKTCRVCEIEEKIKQILKGEGYEQN